MTVPTVPGLPLSDSELEARALLKAARIAIDALLTGEFRLSRRTIELTANVVRGAAPLAPCGDQRRKASDS